MRTIILYIFYRFDLFLDGLAKRVVVEKERDWKFLQKISAIRMTAMRWITKTYFKDDVLMKANMIHAENAIKEILESKFEDREL